MVAPLGAAAARGGLREGGSGADAYEDAFVFGEILAALHGVGVGDAEDLVDFVGVGGVLD